MNWSLQSLNITLHVVSDVNIFYAKPTSFEHCQLNPEYVSYDQNIFFKLIVFTLIYFNSRIAESSEKNRAKKYPNFF